jgi:hypothetical protein
VPRYYPIKQPIDIKTSLSDLINLVLEDGALVANFSIPGDDQHALRVEFERVEMIRTLDEMPLSTEGEDAANEGTLAEHFAYSVDGALFWKQHSETFKYVYANVRHFRFITGWTCLDVISAGEPTLRVVQIEKRAV